MVNRRRVLALLGLGSAGAAGYVVTENDMLSAVQRGSSEQESVTPDDTTPSGPSNKPSGQVGIYSGISGEQVSVSGPQTPFRFDYSPVESTVEGSNILSRITARPVPSGDGDRLVLKPTESITTEELAELLRDLWLSDDEIRVTTTLGDERITFSGGTTGSMAAFVGVRGEETLVTRAIGEDRVSEITKSWNLEGADR